jgi:hypothetical protein
MRAALFDTHALVKTLQTRGFHAEQAEGISDALKEALAIAEIATKSDVTASQEATQRDIAVMQRDITVMQRDITEFREATQLDITASQEATQRDITASQEATQRNIAELREATQRDIKELRLEFKAEIAPLRWGIGLCVASIISLVLRTFF